MNSTKRKVRRLYWIIKKANDHLKIIRATCDHTNVERVNYEWRVGQITEGQIVCADCGEVIRDDDDTLHELK